MQDDLIINKIGTINKCLDRIKYEYEESKDLFKKDFTKQDAVILNLESDSHERQYF